MKIAYATADWSGTVKDWNGIPEIGGAGFYRCDIPARHLTAAGHDARIGLPAFNPDDDVFALQTWDEELWWDFDIFVLQRWMLPDTADHIRRARASGQIIINDLDDWFFGLHSSNAAASSTRAMLPDYLRALQASTVVTCSTPWLAYQLARKGCTTAVVENRLDWSRTEWTPKIHRDTEHLKIGWVGAIPWRSGDIETVARPLQEIMKRHPKLLFHHSGFLAGTRFLDFAELAGIDPDRVDTMPMSPVRGVPGLYQPIDIGIVPLNVIPFNRGKSFLKGLEYAASGVPFVATEIDEYSRLAEAGIGRTVRKPKQWVGAFEELLDFETRRDEAERQEVLVGARYNAALDLGNWLNVYESLR